MANDEKAVLLALCDISGYTRFMVAHREALAHGQVIITELMQALLREANLPLVVAKLEGDAVFLYAVLSGEPKQAVMHNLLAKFDRFFAAFAAKRTELIESNLCACGACRNTDKLQLKIILHVGTALIHQIGRFTELSGTDVILAHRLLKNSVPEEQYLLLTRSALEASGVAPSQNQRVGTEQYKELGTVETFVFLPPLGFAPPASVSPPRFYATFWFRAKNILIKIVVARLTALRLKRRPRFQHLTDDGPASMQAETAGKESP